jgi:hypothetical protein
MTQIPVISGNAKLVINLHMTAPDYGTQPTGHGYWVSNSCPPWCTLTCWMLQKGDYGLWYFIFFMIKWITWSFHSIPIRWQWCLCTMPHCFCWC